MWRSGVVRRRSHHALAELIETAGRTDCFERPWDASPQIWQFFDSEQAVLAALQREWRTALAGAIYVAIEQGEGDLSADVLGAYTKMCDRHHGLRMILEAHSGHPAIAAAMRKERSLLRGFGIGLTLVA